MGFMLISTINMAGSSMRPVPGAPRQKITSYLSEEETVMDQNFFTRNNLANQTNNNETEVKAIFPTSLFPNSHLKLLGTESVHRPVDARE